MTAEKAKAIAETIALGFAALFFGYKAVSGYFYVDLSLNVASQRTHGVADKDLLVVSATLKKGGRGSVRINDAQAKITCKDGSQTVPLVGWYRQSYSTARLQGTERKVVNWNELSAAQPLLRLPPNEETTFSCFVEIPRNAVCTVEVAVLGRERSFFRVGQWKASNISVPITEKA